MPSERSEARRLDSRRKPRVARLVLGALALAGSLALEGCDSSQGRAAPSPATSNGPRTASSASGPTANGALGADSLEQLFRDGKQALAEKNREQLLRLVAPETRDGWLADLVVALAIETSEAGLVSELARRQRNAEMRDILRSFGAQSANRKAWKTGSELSQALLAQVKDRQGLFAALLSFADRHGSALDPERALTGAAEPRASGVPMLRLAERLAPTLELDTGDAGVPALEPGSHALFLRGTERPTQLVLRVFVDGAGRYFLAES